MDRRIDSPIVTDLARRWTINRSVTNESAIEVAEAIHHVCASWFPRIPGRLTVSSIANMQLRELGSTSYFWWSSMRTRPLARFVRLTIPRSIRTTPRPIRKMQYGGVNVQAVYSPSWERSKRPPG